MHSNSKCHQTAIDARWYARVLALLWLLAGTAAPAQPAAAVEELQIEDLLKLTVTSATRRAQPISEAPAAVSVVTAAQIRRFGYRTLGEVLESVPGIYINGDRTYQYIGVRGFARAGDYNTRVLMLIDGNRVNDNVFNTAAMGGDFPLEVESIERVEFVPGAGSALYGSNAFFGVINVVTRHAEARPGADLVLKQDSQNRNAAWIGFTAAAGTAGKLSIDVAHRGGRGPSLHYPSFDTPGGSDGNERGVDFERAQRIFGRYSGGGFSASLILSDRNKGLSGAPYGVTFNDPGAVFRDRTAIADAGYGFAAGPATDVNLRGYWGEYRFHGAYPSAGPLLNRDLSIGQWYGGEARLVHRGWRNHVVQAGIELRHDAKIVQRNFDEDPQATYLDDLRKGAQQSIFIQDEWRLGNSILTFGMRRDRSSSAGARINPRASWVTPFGDGYIFKAAAGTAFRAPNAYESFYASPTLVPPAKPNPSLKPERIRSLDLAINRSFGSWTAGINAWTYHMSDVIAQITDPADGIGVFTNGAALRGRGADLELGHRWANGAQANLALSLTRVRDASGAAAVMDSPGRLTKLRLAMPVWSGAALALSVQGISRRQGALDSVPGHAMSNLVLSNLRIAPNLSLDAGVYNLFNQRAFHPVATFFTFNATEQNRRHLQMTLRLGFR